MPLAQLSDTHVTRRDATYFGIDTTRYLRDAIDALHALAPRPDLVVVTGDLVNRGHDDEYDRFAGAIRAGRRYELCVAVTCVKNRVTASQFS
jgi:3',5'-cyclic AMP phosphodiesterase CpdA